ncbi:MAG TPA: DUF1573 domain-containing protein, partial [Planctomycetota bacterium]|nr:DUF1573 domain-containing protein [Planctomycetota bacterium]
PAVVDFGDVLGGEPALATVKVKNISDAPVPIKQVKTTCGCTVATVHGPDGTEIPARPPQPDMLVTTLEPGQELSVDVKMETANAQGSIEKHLQVYAGDGAVLTLDVPVKARISKAFTVSPDRVDLHNAARTGRIEQTVVVQAQSIGNWTIDGFESAFDGTPLPPWIQLSVLDTEGLSRRVQIVSDGPRPVGPFTARVRIRIGHEKVKNVDFTIYGIIRPDVSFDTGNPTTPDSVSFDQMKKGDVVTRTIKITNSDASIPYLLKSAEIQAPEQLKPLIQSAITTLQEGVSYEVVLTAKAEMAEAFFRGNVLLVAEHPDLARHPISFHGWVKQQQ